VPAQTLLDYLGRTGNTLDEFLEMFPTVSTARGRTPRSSIPTRREGGRGRWGNSFLTRNLHRHAGCAILGRAIRVATGPGFGVLAGGDVRTGARMLGPVRGGLTMGGRIFVNRE